MMEGFKALENVELHCLLINKKFQKAERDTLDHERI